MDFKCLSIFRTIAELNSFSKAADILNIAQPILSKQIRQLEIKLKTHLFIRTGRGVNLTESGKRLLKHTEIILPLINNLFEDFSQIENKQLIGKIRIGLTPSIARNLTLPLIEKFKNKYPLVNLEIIENFSKNLSEKLIENKLDLCLLYNPENNQNLIINPLFKEQLCLIGNCQKSLKKSSINLIDLKDYPLILANKNQLFRDLLENQATLSGIKLNIAWEVSNLDAIFDLLIADFGFAVLTKNSLLSYKLSKQAKKLNFMIIKEPEIICTLCLIQKSSIRETNLIKQTKLELLEIFNKKNFL